MKQVTTEKTVKIYDCYVWKEENQHSRFLLLFLFFFCVQIWRWKCLLLPPSNCCWLMIFSFLLSPLRPKKTLQHLSLSPTVKVAVFFSFSAPYVATAREIYKRTGIWLLQRRKKREKKQLSSSSVREEIICSSFLLFFLGKWRVVGTS